MSNIYYNICNRYVKNGMHGPETRTIVHKALIELLDGTLERVTTRCVDTT